MNAFDWTQMQMQMQTETHKHARVKHKTLHALTLYGESNILA